MYLKNNCDNRYKIFLFQMGLGSFNQLRLYQYTTKCLERSTVELIVILSPYNSFNC